MYAVLYFTMIGIFAGFYDRHAGDFYDAAAIQESGFHSTQAQLFAALSADLRADVRTAPPLAGTGHLTLQPGSVRLASVNIPAVDEIGAQIGYRCGRAGEVVITGMQLTFDAHPTYRSLLPDGDELDGLEVRQLHRDLLCGQTIGQLAGVQHLPGTDAVVIVRPSTALLTRALSRAKAGYVDELPGRWWRAVYLSAVTITTLGFGDVVPVTTQARVLVGLEAVLGITVAGLFLNALARGLRRPPLSPEPAARPPGQHPDHPDGPDLEMPAG